VASMLPLVLTSSACTHAECQLGCKLHDSRMTSELPYTHLTSYTKYFFSSLAPVPFLPQNSFKLTSSCPNFSATCSEILLTFAAALSALDTYCYIKPSEQDSIQRLCRHHHHLISSWRPSISKLLLLQRNYHANHDLPSLDRQVMRKNKVDCANIMYPALLSPLLPRLPRTP
jgi:hypothetical protein